MLKLTIENLSKLTNGTIMSIAMDLGCPVKYPKLNFTGDTYEENDQKFEEYMRDLREWLEKEGYLVEIGRVLC